MSPCLMCMVVILCLSSLFFFNDTATTEIYTLSLHVALPISRGVPLEQVRRGGRLPGDRGPGEAQQSDRKSTRLNSSHSQISYAVFCLKKKKTTLAHDRARQCSVQSLPHYFQIQRRALSASLS